MLVIILPGWMHTERQWSAVCAQLKHSGTSYRFIDIPGFGNTEPDPSLTDVNTVTEWLHTELQSVTEPYLLCGHSFGGRIAVAYQNAHPQNVQKLCLIGSPNLYRPDFQTKVKKRFVKYTKLLRSLLPESLRQRFRSTDFDMVRGTSLETLFKNVIAHDQLESLREIKIKTFLLWGSEDAAVPLRVANEIAANITDSTIDIIAGAGHNVHQEKPLLIAAKIMEYAKSV